MIQLDINFHSIRNFSSSLKVRFGEWNLDSTAEPLPYKEYPVAATFIHPNFDATNSKNNIAVLRLSTDVMLGAYPTIGTGCLPCEF